jgi:hypothetical protein
MNRLGELIVKRLIAALIMLVSGVAAHAADSYDTATHLLTIPAVQIGNTTYAGMVVKVGSIVSGPSGTSPNASQDIYNTVNHELSVAEVTVGSATYYNVVITVAGVESVGSFPTDAFDGTHLTLGSLQLDDAFYSQVVLKVGISNLVGIAGGIPATNSDQYYIFQGRLFIPAVQLAGHVYTNVSLSVAPADVVSVGGGGPATLAAASAFLQNYYVAGTYSTNDAGTGDRDSLADFSFSACATAGSPCQFVAPALALSASGATSGGTLSDETYGGLITSPNTGALTPFYIPTSVTFTTTDGYQWQGAIGLPDSGGVLVAMQTDANATPGIRVGLVPKRGVSNASLAGPVYTFVGIATNRATGVAGDEGILDSLQFDGQTNQPYGTGDFSGVETTNTWNPATRTGGIHPTSGGTSGVYAVASDGSLLLVFLTGANAGVTMTGAMNDDLIVLTNLGNAGPRVLLAGVAGPTTTQAQQTCTNNPLFGPAFADAVFDEVDITFNNSVLQQVTYNNTGAPPYTFTQNGGLLNAGGMQSAYPAGDTATYTVDDNCGITQPRQTDSLGNVFEYSIGAVSLSGAVYAVTDFDTSGGGPQLHVGVHFSNTEQLQ